MEYSYPAVFHANDDGSFTITYPDLPGCVSEGKSKSSAMLMAHSALTQWLGYLMDKGRHIPSPSRLVPVGEGEFVEFVSADLASRLEIPRRELAASGA
ncbi:MAG: type II toxin-antitoxin system HicB family antitoxin [Synergistaceae bacterium]|jgi:predicted RNase H-like HicB family nuclease|nr:type II toxin-antitoxin system HicB family antitoxin [Synergistaceae bacterium]